MSDREMAMFLTGFTQGIIEANGDPNNKLCVTSYTAAQIIDGDQVPNEDVSEMSKVFWEVWKDVFHDKGQYDDPVAPGPAAW